MNSIPLRDGHIFYALELPVHYEILTRGFGTGCGRTLRFGSHGLVFASDRVLEVKWKIQLTLDWPVPLPDGVALTFCAFGRIVEVDSHIVSVALSKHEFRTRGKIRAAAAR